LRISGLTGIAVTVVGGTGALGLVAGFALKNILENYFSGVMLSVSNPYNVGDVITVNGKKGVVQTLTTRGTVLVDFDGNHIIIPNSTIYGNTIVNETANPSTRVRFPIGIDYAESPKRVREVILSAIKEAKDVLDKPESLVLMSEFAASAIVYDVFFWIDSRKSSSSRMKSLVMELVRHRLKEQKIKIPGEVRELVISSSDQISQSAMSLGKAPQSEADANHASQAAAPETPPAPSETELESHGLLNEANKGRTIAHGEKLI
jgi:small-conductance mechanosensitive channel